MSPSAALTWAAAGCLIDLSPVSSHRFGVSLSCARSAASFLGSWSRRCVAAAQGGDSVAVEFIAVERAASHGHDQGQGGAGHEWPGAGGEGAVGGREPEAA